MFRNLLFLGAAMVLGALNTATARAANVKPMIINGSDLKVYELPQMAMLSAAGWKCSATLIGPKVILTAAHCVQSPHGAQTRQVFGPVDGRYHKATLEAHPKYDGRTNNIPFDMAMKYDLAVGILDDEPTVAPVSVTSDAPALKDTVLYAGIGRPRVGTRQYGYANVVTLSTLGMTIRGFGSLPQIGFPGDSGGPIFKTETDGSLVVAAVASTSTLDSDFSSSGWPEALPYTEGTSRVFLDSFVTDFATSHNVNICGLNTNCPAVFFK